MLYLKLLCGLLIVAASLLAAGKLSGREKEKAEKLRAAAEGLSVIRTGASLCRPLPQILREFNAGPLALFWQGVLNDITQRRGNDLQEIFAANAGCVPDEACSVLETAARSIDQRSREQCSLQLELCVTRLNALAEEAELVYRRRLSFYRRISILCGGVIVILIL